MDYTIRHNKELQRFELITEEKISIVEYELSKNKIFFTHTKVPKELEGKGIASILVRYAINYAIENQLEIIPVCSFVKVYLDRHQNEFSGCPG